MFAPTADAGHKVMRVVLGYRQGAEKGVTMRFVHVYAMKPEPDRVRAVAPGTPLTGYGLGPAGTSAGPSTTDQAASSASRPFRRKRTTDAWLTVVREELLASSSIERWLVEP